MDEKLLQILQNVLEGNPEPIDVIDWLNKEGYDIITIERLRYLEETEFHYASVSH